MRRHRTSRGWPRPLSLAIAAALVVSLAGASTAALATDPEPALGEWITENAQPLATTDPDAPLDDLAPLRDMVGDAAIVGLGESTHGASEEYRLKHRVLRLLVEEMGFRSIAWEDDWTLGLQVNDYILTGDGDPEELVGRMATTFRAREVVDVLRWLRQYNASHDDKVQFVGVEFFATGLPAYDGVTDHVAEVAPERLPELRQNMALIRPQTDDIGQHVGWYYGVEDKQPYVRAAREVYELVKGLDYEKGDAREIALQHARQILSFYEYFTLQGGEQFNYRDARAAQNVRWWRQRTGDKVAYWAATAHTADAPGLRLSNPPEPETVADTAGSHLRRWYGQRYRSIGFTFDHGTVMGSFSEPPYTPRPLPVPSPEPDWAEAPLGEVELDQFALDLRADAPPPSVRAWMKESTRTRVIAPNYTPENANAYYIAGEPLTRWFDVIVHRQEVTPWQPL